MRIIIVLVKIEKKKLFKLFWTRNVSSSRSSKKTSKKYTFIKSFGGKIVRLYRVY